jgi:hypothetical protein
MANIPQTELGVVTEGRSSNNGVEKREYPGIAFETQALTYVLTIESKMV